jgi:hypothetical protein
MYIIESIHINPTENLFFGKFSVSKEIVADFYNPIIAKHLSNGSFPAWQKILPIYEMRIDQLPTGEWQRTGYTKFFTTFEIAEQFFRDTTTPGSEYRTLLKQFHNTHKILNETNILDENYQLVKTINSCQGNMCRHYGQCNSSGCDIIPTRHPQGMYPVYHLRVSN